MAKYKHANCMGYALGINSWMHPLGWEDDIEEGMIKYILDGLAYFEYRQYDGPIQKLRLVHRKEMKLGKEYIAFRWGNQSYNDFHFMKRGKKGHWRHKMGGGRVEVISQKEVFSATWKTRWHSYDSKIYLFEVV